MLTRLILLILVLLLVVLPTQAQNPTRDYYPTRTWRNAAPSSQGMDAAFPIILTDRIRSELPYVRGAMVVRHGYVVYEGYFQGLDKDRLHSVRSVTKSITSALVGIALERGDLPNLDVTFANYFPEYFQGNDNRYKREISLRNLIMMRSGLGWREGERSNILDLASSPDDQMQRIISLPIDYTAGQFHRYSTADPHLVSGMMTRATGMTMGEYAERYLFAPLGITRYEWLKDSGGYNVGGTELAMTLPDLAKFGYLYLNEGQWDGEQVIPADWVRLTTSPQPDFPTYGYLWWMSQPTYFKAAGFVAFGYGGQYIAVLPELDMVVVVACNYDGFGTGVAGDHASAVKKLIQEVILAAVVE